MVAQDRRLIADPTARRRLLGSSGKALVTFAPVALHDLEQGFAGLFPRQLEQRHEIRGRVLGRIVLDHPAICRDFALPPKGIGADPLHLRRLALKGGDKRFLELSLRIGRLFWPGWS